MLLIGEIGPLVSLTTGMSRTSADEPDRPARVVADKAPPATGFDAISTESIPESASWRQSPRGSFRSRL